MLVLGRLENKNLIAALSLLMISVIGVADYFIEPDISFSIFYLFPISWLAINKPITKKIIIVNTLYASFLWFIAEYLTKDYSNSLYAIWNAVVRFSIFITIGLLLHNLKERHAKMQQMNEHLANLNQEKNKFIGIAAHDLRSPISGIYSFSNLILTDKKENLNPQTIQLITLIKSASKNALDLVENLLDISKIESGTLELNLQQVNYNEFLEEYIHLNQVIADKKNIKLKLECVSIGILIKIDGNYMSQVINNLISNAIKFSPKESHITIRVSEIENKILKTEVIDNGRGIALHEQTKLFNYFHKTSTEPTSGEKSTGLGLAIAKRIVVEHGGTIGVISEKDMGSVFFFELPIL